MSVPAACSHHHSPYLCLRREGSSGRPRRRGGPALRASQRRTRLVQQKGSGVYVGRGRAPAQRERVVLIEPAKQHLVRRQARAAHVLGYELSRPPPQARRRVNTSSPPAESCPSPCRSCPAWQPTAQPTAQPTPQSTAQPAALLNEAAHEAAHEAASDQDADVAPYAQALERVSRRCGPRRAVRSSRRCCSD